MVSRIPLGIPFPIVASISASSALFLVPAIANRSGSPASHHTTSSAIRSRAASISQRSGSGDGRTGRCRATAVI
jgi:hypothetical protein